MGAELLSDASFEPGLLVVRPQAGDDVDSGEDRVGEGETDGRRAEDEEDEEDGQVHDFHRRDRFTGVNAGLYGGHREAGGFHFRDRRG